MPRRRDPIEHAADDGLDLYDVATWEPRSILDRLAAAVYRWLVRITHAVVVILAVVILVGQLVLSGFATTVGPEIGVFVLLSVIPALAIVVYVWGTDVTIREPVPMLVVTFMLGVLFAGFAALLNTITLPVFGVVPVVGLALFFFVVVGPVEETVKWLAVRLYAYRSRRFNAVLDGAVYGAVAGLGFATIENMVFIGGRYLEVVQAGSVGMSPLEAVVPITAARTLAGPGHVLYSAYAGYYLGLAKFNPDNAGPIIVKGLLVAALVHAAYNTLVTYVPVLVFAAGVTVSPFLLFLGIVIVYDGAFGYILYRKISRYRRMYRATNAGRFLGTGGRPPEPPTGPGPRPTDIPAGSHDSADAPERLPDEPEDGDPGDDYRDRDA